MSENNELLASIREAIANNEGVNPVGNAILPKETPAQSTDMPPASHEEAAKQAAAGAAAEEAAAEATPDTQATEAVAAATEELDPVAEFYKSLEAKKAPVANAAEDANRFEREARDRAAAIEREANERAKEILTKAFSDPAKAAAILGVDPLDLAVGNFAKKQQEEDDPKFSAFRKEVMSALEKRDAIIAKQQQELEQLNGGFNSQREAQHKAYLQAAEKQFLGGATEDKFPVLRAYWKDETIIAKAREVVTSLNDAAQRAGVPVVQLSNEQLLGHLEKLAEKEVDAERDRYQRAADARAKKAAAAPAKKPPPRGMNPDLAGESKKVAGGTVKDPSAMDDKEWKKWAERELRKDLRAVKG